MTGGILAFRYMLCGDRNAEPQTRWTNYMLLRVLRYKHPAHAYRNQKPITFEQTDSEPEETGTNERQARVVTSKYSRVVCFCWEEMPHCLRVLPYSVS